MFFIAKKKMRGNWAVAISAARLSTNPISRFHAKLNAPSANGPVKAGRRVHTVKEVEEEYGQEVDEREEDLKDGHRDVRDTHPKAYDTGGSEESIGDMAPFGLAHTLRGSLLAIEHLLF